MQALFNFLRVTLYEFLGQPGNSKFAMRISNRPVGQTRRNSTRDSTQILCVKTASQSTRIRETWNIGYSKIQRRFVFEPYALYIYTQQPPMTSLPIVLDTTIRIKIISRRQKRRLGISSLMKRELESLGLRGVAFPEGEGEGGSVYLSNGSSGLRKEDGEHVQRRKNEERGKGIGREKPDQFIY